MLNDKTSLSSRAEIASTKDAILELSVCSAMRHFGIAHPEVHAARDHAMATWPRERIDRVLRSKNSARLWKILVQRETRSPLIFRKTFLDNLGPTEIGGIYGFSKQMAAQTAQTLMEYATLNEVKGKTAAARLISQIEKEARVKRPLKSRETSA